MTNMSPKEAPNITFEHITDQIEAIWLQKAADVAFMHFSDQIFSFNADSSLV